VVSIIGLFFVFLIAVWLLINFINDPSDFLNIFLIGLTRGCVYALVALGYTLVYGILQLINFAHGDVFALCGLVAASVINTVFGVTDGSSSAYFWLVITVTLFVIMGFGAAVNTSIEFIGYRRLRSAPRLAALISAFPRLQPDRVGLSLGFIVVIALGNLRGLRESGRIFLEGAPASAPPGEVGRAIVEHDGVVEAHDLHVWTVTSGFPALSAHVLVEPGADCHRIRLELENMLAERFGLEHTTLQVEHVGAARGLEIRRTTA